MKQQRTLGWSAVLLGTILYLLTRDGYGVGGAFPDTNRDIVPAALGVVSALLMVIGVITALPILLEVVRRPALRFPFAIAWFVSLSGMLAWVGFGSWAGVRDVVELRSLRAGGRAATAQVINVQTVGADAQSGLIGYALHTDLAVVVGQLRIPRSEMRALHIMDPLAAVYLPSDPHVYRLGTVDGGRLFRRGVLWTLYILRGLALFGLPFFGLEKARRQVMRPRRMPSALSSPVPSPIK